MSDEERCKATCEWVERMKRAGTYDEMIDLTCRFWECRGRGSITEAEAIEIVDNALGYCELLSRWFHEEKSEE